MQTFHRQYSRRYISVRPWQLWLVVVALVVVGIGALPAGYSFVRDPSGRSLGIPAGTLDSTLFPDYLVPGLFLFFVIGIGSLTSALAVLLRPQWDTFQRLNPFKRQEWSWSFALLMGVTIMAWIVVQLLSITLSSFLQPAIFALGAAIVICLLTPKVRAFLAWE